MAVPTEVGTPTDVAKVVLLGLLGVEMRYLILVGILIVVFGGAAMDLHLRKLTKFGTLEVMLWTTTLALFVVLLIMIGKNILDKLLLIVRLLNTILEKLK